MDFYMKMKPVIFRIYPIHQCFYDMDFLTILNCALQHHTIKFRKPDWKIYQDFPQFHFVLKFMYKKSKVVGPAMGSASHLQEYENRHQTWENDTSPVSLTPVAPKDYTRAHSTSEFELTVVKVAKSAVTTPMDITRQCVLLSMRLCSIRSKDTCAMQCRW